MVLQSLIAALPSTTGVGHPVVAPLQMGIPGGVELLVIGMIAMLLFGIPLALIAVVGYLWLRNDDDYEERIRELESEIATLQAEIGSDDSSQSDTEE